MAIIIETCPKCGHDLINEMICTYPPIPRKSCPSCGWSWEGEQEEVVRIPFGGNSYTEFAESDLNTVTRLEATTPAYSNSTNNVIAAMETFIKTIEEHSNKLNEKLEEYDNKLGNVDLMGDFEQPACVNCPNSIKNGGSGICGCVLGQVPVT